MLRACTSFGSCRCDGGAEQTEGKITTKYVKGSSHTALMSRSWLEKIKLNWQEVHLAKESTSLQNILRKHAEVFGDELGNMKDITVKLAVKPDCKP